MRTNNGGNTELFQLLGLLGVTDERSNLKGISLGVIQECGEGRTTNVAWLRTRQGRIQWIERHVDITNSTSEQDLNHFNKHSSGDVVRRAGFWSLIAYMDYSIYCQLRSGVTMRNR